MSVSRKITGWREQEEVSKTVSSDIFYSSKSDSGRQANTFDVSDFNLMRPVHRIQRAYDSKTAMMLKTNHKAVLGNARCLPRHSCTGPPYRQGSGCVWSGLTVFTLLPRGVQSFMPVFYAVYSQEVLQINDLIKDWVEWD